MHSLFKKSSATDKATAGDGTPPPHHVMFGICLRDGKVSQSSLLLAIPLSGLTAHHTFRLVKAGNDDSVPLNVPVTVAGVPAEPALRRKQLSLMGQ